MLKNTIVSINIGTTFSIRNSWRTKIAKQLNKDEELFPFNFQVVSIENDEYVCESIPDGKSKKKHSVVVDPIIIQYLNGLEVDDVNVGLYFNDYLPIENSKLLIYNPRHSTIMAAHFKFSIEMIDNLPKLSFVLEDLLNGNIYTIASQIKNSWKMLNGIDTYMTDIEKMYQDTFVHKDYVMQVCSKFAEYLREQDLEEDAKKLMERAASHDNSKIVNKDEFRALTSIINDKSCLGDAKAQLSMFKQDSIELHWKHNAHHPEHFTSYDDMSRIDRMEMVCDWMARSIQYKSDLLQFVETRQNERFHFSELMYDEIYHYCKILTSLFSH